MTALTIRVLLTLVIGLARSAAAQETTAPADTVIRLQRTACYGSCPIYSVTIDARGAVTYDGEKFVRVVGRQTARVAPSVVASLLTSAERIRFFDLRDAYRVINNPDGTVLMVTDLPTTITTMTVNGRTKRVENYVGAPDELAAFERAIDEAAGTKRWTFIDKEALKDAAVAQALLKAGARLEDVDDGRTALFYAACAGNRRVRLPCACGQHRHAVERQCVTRIVTSPSDAEDIARNPTAR
jgi:hypothetical protein